MPPAPIWPVCCRTAALPAGPRAAAGADARAMLERPLAGYLLLNCEPWADAAQPGALETLASRAPWWP